MSGLVVAYISELAEGRLPREDSAEAVAYKAWSAAYERNRISNQIVKESGLKVYGSDYYLLGSMV